LTQVRHLVARVSGMQVNVIMFGAFAEALSSESKNGRVMVEIGEPANVAQVLDQLGVPPERRTYVTVNGRHVGLETLVSEGDEIRVIVPLGGG